MRDNGPPYRTTCALCQQPFSAMTEDRVIREFTGHLRQVHRLRVDGTPLTEAEREILTKALGPPQPIDGVQ